MGTGKVKNHEKYKVIITGHLFCDIFFQERGGLPLFPLPGSTAIMSILSGNCNDLGLGLAMKSKSLEPGGILNLD